MRIVEEPVLTLLDGHRSPSARRRGRAVLMLALAAGLSACGLATGISPTVEVMGVRSVGIELTEQQLETTLCITNPNPNRIGFRSVTADLDVSGAPLASGTSATAVDLPPASSTVVSFTVRTTVRNVGPQLLAILREGSLDYQIHGTVSLNGALGLTLPFARSGRLDLLEGGLALASNAVSTAPNHCSAEAASAALRL